MRIIKTQQDLVGRGYIVVLEAGDVFERLAEVVRKPKLLEDIVVKLNKNRTKSVVPLQKELAAIEKELESIERQRKKYFKLYEASDVDDDLFVERLNELKQL